MGRLATGRRWRSLARAALAVSLLAAAPAPAEIRAVDLKGLEARSAALLMSGQEAGQLSASFLALPVAAAAERRPVVLVADLVGASLLEGASGTELIVELYAYALGPQGELLGTLARAFRLDLADYRVRLEEGGVKFLGRLDLPPGESSLRLLVLHRASGRFALRTLAVEVADAAPAAAGIGTPPIVPEPAGPWLVVRGVDGETALPPPFDDPSLLPATRLVAPAGGSRRPVLAASDARLADAEGRPRELTLHRPAAAGGPAARAELDIEAQPPGSYRLLLSGGEGAAVELPLELVAGAESGAAWFQRPAAGAAAEETPAGGRPARGRAPLQQLALSAYLEAFEAWRAEGLEAAAAELRRFEAEAVAEAIAGDIEQGQVRAAAELVAGDVESLVPLMCLHETLFRLYYGHGRRLLAAHARRMANHFARRYAESGSGPHAGRTAALVLVSVAGLRQEIGTRIAAQSTFEQALELDPAQPEALLGLAALHESYGGHDTAVEMLRRLARVAPLSPAARIRLAVNLTRVGSLRQALAELRDLAGSPPEWISVLAYQEWVRILADDRRPEEALEVLEAALDRHPGRQGLIIQRAALLDRMGRPLESRRALAAVESLTGDHGESPRLRYSALPSQEIAAARERLARAAGDRIAGTLESARRMEARGAP